MSKSNNNSKVKWQRSGDFLYHWKDDECLAFAAPLGDDSSYFWAAVDMYNDMVIVGQCGDKSDALEAAEAALKVIGSGECAIAHVPVYGDEGGDD